MKKTIIILILMCTSLIAKADLNSNGEFISHSSVKASDMNEKFRRLNELAGEKNLSLSSPFGLFYQGESVSRLKILNEVSKLPLDVRIDSEVIASN